MVDESDSEGREFEDTLYDQFPRGADDQVGTLEGYNTIVQLNDPSLFTEAALDNPVIKEFLAAPFSVSYIQLKSSHREAEWYIHKPERVLAGGMDGIEGSVPEFPQSDGRIGTYVINHERTLAKSIMRALIIQDGAQTGQIVHKAVDPGG
jgi:hypothetical protein